MEKKDILVIGSSNVDLIMKMDRLPAKGETVTDAVFRQTFGGKGANQAVAAARAGGKVTFVSCVGDDHYGHAMIDNYKIDKINTSHISVIQGVPSGTALIMIGEDGNNYLSVAPGANYKMSPNHIDRIGNLIESAGPIVLQYEIHPATLGYILNKCKGRKVMLNFAPAKPLEETLLGFADILVVNETEAQFLTGKPRVGRDHAAEAARILYKKGISTVIITLGIEGSYIFSDEFTGHVNAFPVKAVDTTAAGDVYCGTLAACLAEGMSIQEAVRYSSAASAICVTRLGAQSSIPLKVEIDDFLMIN